MTEPIGTEHTYKIELTFELTSSQMGRDLDDVTEAAWEALLGHNHLADMGFDGYRIGGYKVTVLKPAFLAERQRKWDKKKALAEKAKAK